MPVLTRRVIIAALLVASFAVSAAAESIDIERLSPPRSSNAGELVTHVFSIRNSDFVPIDIEISLELPPGWHELGVPSSLRVEPQEESFVFVTLSVPPTALALDYEPVLAVRFASSDAEPAPSWIRVVAPVRILPVRNLLLESTEVMLRPGSTASTEIRIVNRGNVQEQVELVVSPPSQVHIEWSPTVAAISPSEALPVAVVVRADASAGPGRILVPVVARSTIHEAGAVQGFVEVEILPPDPSSIPSTVAAILPVAVVIDSSQTFPVPPATPMPATSVSLSGEKDLGESALRFRLQLESLFGPRPLSVSSFLVGYETPSVSMKIGDLSTSLTRLLQATVTGARLSASTSLLAGLAVIGVEPTAATAGGTLVLGPDKFRVGGAYLERRTADTQVSSVAGFLQGSPALLGGGNGETAVDAPAEWWIELEGAVGQDDGTRSWAGTGSIRCDVSESFVALSAFRIGGAFPFGLADRTGYELSQRYRSDALSLGTSFSHEQSNVEHDPAAVTVISDRLGLTLDIVPAGESPEMTAIADLERHQAIEPGEDDLCLSYAIAVKQARTSFPFRSFVRLTDRWDRTFDRRLREWDLAQDFGIALESWTATLSAEFETVLDPRTAETLDGASRFSLLIEALGAELGGTLLGTMDKDHRNLTLSVRSSPNESTDIVFDVGLAWDRNDASVPQLSLGLTITSLFDLPVPFALDSGQIEGRVFIDSNQNGVYDFALENGDPPLESVIVALTGEPQLVSTDAAGLFRFPPLPAGRYRVDISAAPDEAVLDAPIEVDLAVGERRFVDVPLRPSLRIAGTVIEVGHESTSEPEGQLPADQVTQTGIPAARMTLLSDGQIVQEALTSASGRYEFSDLGPGSYVVTVDETTLPDRFELTTPDSIDVSLEHVSTTIVDFVGSVPPRQLVITFQPPFADFSSSPDPASAASPVSFDGGWSLDFDGEIVAYQWDLDGDGTPDAAGEIVEHTFSAPGTYPVTLTVIDNDGATDTVTLLVIVE